MVQLCWIYGAFMVQLWFICGAFVVHLWCNLMVIRSVSSNVADKPELISLMLSEASSFFKTQSLVEVQKTVLITDTFLKKACVLQYTVTQTLSLLGSSKLSRKLQAWLSVSELSPWIRIVQNPPFITDCVTNSVAEPPRFSCDSNSGLNTFLLLLLGHFFWKLNFSERLQVMILQVKDLTVQGGDWEYAY